MYRLRPSRKEKKKLLHIKWLIVFAALVVSFLIVWLAWVRPLQNESSVSSFAECKDAGNPIQESYPEVCVAKSGKRFVNPDQQQAHEQGLKDADKLVPPTNPDLLKLDIEEWGIRVPLTTTSFDLSYAYFENGTGEYLQFTYKRLVALDVCKGDIGLTIVRNQLKREPPYTASNPAPIAQLGGNYFYASTAAAPPCYDLSQPDQAAIIKDIAGNQSLTQTTTNLFSKLVALPRP